VFSKFRYFNEIEPLIRKNITNKANPIEDSDAATVKINRAKYWPIISSNDSDIKIK